MRGLRNFGDARLEDLSQSQRATLVKHRIKPQFPDNPGGLLMYKIVALAITDLGGDQLGNRNTAEHYLRSGMSHAEVAGVSAEWIMDSLVTVGLLAD